MPALQHQFRLTCQMLLLVRTISTSDETIETLKRFAISLGKSPVLAEDTAGFIVNFMLIPYLLAAIRMLENGMATRDDIDTAMKLGCGYPMGPFTSINNKKEGASFTAPSGHLLFSERN